MPSLLKTRCPHCQVVAKVSDDHLGKRVRCPTCKQPFEVLSVEVGHSSPATIEAACVAEETIGDGGVGDRSAEVVGRATATPTSPNTIETARPLGSLGRFELKELLGQGAFGRVYKAYDPQLDRFVAFKVPTFGRGDKHKIQRFIAEAKAAAKLRHPNIVPTYESGQVGGRYYIAAQFIAGQPLSKRIKENPPDFRQSADWVRQLGDALAYAHKQGIVHRDIKPDNIMLDEKGVPQIMDFGLAKRVNEDSNMTTDGTILGTPAYMAPEQAKGEPGKVGPHSDQYSLGVVLYELLTGRRPFEGPPHAVIAQVIRVEPPAPRSFNAQIPRDLDAICQKAMSKDVEQRYSDCQHLSVDLYRWLGGFETRARRIGVVEWTSRWCRRNPLVAGLASAALIAVVAGLVGTTAALWRANVAWALADSNAIAAEEQRQFAQDNLAEARRQQQIAEENARISIERQAEAEAANRAEREKSRELAGALAELERAAARVQSESDARNLAEKVKETLETTKAKLEESSAQLTAELETSRRSNPQLLYADRIGRANEAILAERFPDATALLQECPADLRSWEWRYLMARARQVKDVVRTVTVEHRLLPLNYSPDDRFVLCQTSPLGQQARSPNHPQLMTLEVGTGNAIAVPSEADIVTAGEVAAFSRDGTYLLVASLVKAAVRSHLRLLKRIEGSDWQVEADLGLCDGFAIASAQNASGEWLVLTADAITSPVTKLGEPLVLHHFNSGKKIKRTELIKNRTWRPLTDGKIHGVCFDDEASKIYFLLSNWKAIPAGRSVVRCHEYDPAAGWKTISDTIEATRDRGSTLPSKGLYLPMNASGNIFCTAPRYVSVLGIRHPELMSVASSAGAFTPDGKRLIVYSAERGLDVIDPNGINATRPILSIPIKPNPNPAQDGPPPKLTMSRSGTSVMVMLPTFRSTILMFFDVYGGQ